jgi:hypothetical protein
VWGCTDLSFKDQWLTDEIPLSAPGTPALTTVAQEIIPAINEAAVSSGDASSVDIAVLGAPPFSNVQDFINQIGSAGSSDDIYITPAGGATVDVAAGHGFIRILNNNNAELQGFEWPALLGTIIPAGTALFFGVDFAGGVPVVVPKANDVWNGHTEFRLGSVVNQDGIHPLNNPQRISDALADTFHRLYETRPFERANRLGGIIIGELGTRNVSLTLGELYDGLNEFIVGPIDTSAADTFDRYYGDGGVGWTAQLAQTQWNNTQYDDGSGLLATMTNNWFKNVWFYVEADNNLVLLFGQGQFATLQMAEEQGTPSTVPIRLQTHGRFIGRFVVQKNAATADSIESSFDEDFNTTAVTDHALMGNVTANQHHQEDHEARHNQAGADPLKLDNLATPDDNTDLNVSITRHGLTPKLPNDVAKFLNGTGGYTVPPSGGTLDDAYDASGGISTVIVDNGDVVWDINGNYSFLIDLAGLTLPNVDGFRVGNGTDEFKVMRIASNDLRVQANCSTFDINASLTLDLDSEGTLFFSDGNRSGSTYSASMLLTDSQADWTTFKTNFGQVSLLNALNQTGNYTYVVANLSALIALVGMTAGQTAYMITAPSGKGLAWVFNGTTWQVTGQTTQWINRSGGAVSEGDMLIVDIANPNSVIATTTLNDDRVVGPVVIGAIDGNPITMATDGGIWDVNFDSSGAVIGDYARTSNTTLQAQFSIAGIGSIGMCVEARVGTGLARVWMSGKELV